VTRPRNNAATPVPDVDAFIDNMALNHIQCRDFGHSWRPYRAWWDASEHCYISQLRCSRCRTVRHRYIGQNGQLIAGHYEYADGYLVKGIGRLTGGDRDHIRLASISRVLVPDTAEEEG
jgi:hypothetical protein